MSDWTPPLLWVVLVLALCVWLSGPALDQMLAPYPRPVNVAPVRQW